MDSLGNSKEDLGEHVEAAARRALHDWGHPIEGLDDLVQDLWVWYLARPSTQEMVNRPNNNQTFIRNLFYRAAGQTLAGQVLDADVFKGNDLYSADAVKDWLAGASTNKYLGKLIQKALTKLSDQNAEHRSAIRDRYEEGDPRYLVPGAPAMLLSRAVKSLTGHVNALAIEDKQGDTVRPSRGVSAGSRRGGGGYSDPTADMALGLIRAGDAPIETASGEVTTMRKEFEDADNIMASRYDSPTPPWSGIDLFEGELNDRTDMYRAQVFPELYPDEKPMMVGNWSREDQEAYCGGEYTAGYRRLKVVR
jgi:hypothetical protein